MKKSVLYEDIIFRMLVSSVDLTTELLELITEDRLEVKVTKQQKLETDNIILRESFLFSHKYKMTISQNIVILYSDFMPLDLFNSIMLKKEGIGHLLKRTGSSSTRKIIRSGYRQPSEVINLQNEPFKLQFESQKKIPFKEYKVRFDSYPIEGMQLVEYFNPEMISEIIKYPMKLSEERNSMV
ncbi:MULTISPECIES: hypothetical protein [Paenibacillus]|uniref:DUF98 domain-containing protein n=1 Tax=Paenibacillus cucumis (ex Kampfer et al. 2016) TaxID=1776858 RepID=A0ABS7KSX4_9BACL|nr:hypothetical protein [Paenibacillus cucumis (ex Kampfer et al. 2016)]MBY0207111.1 hypothetical protein [Paenibacillus cucumis (ex Kampfer et al. 2016)]MDP9698989.1 hypothetical protein [Paenibacillus intestini]